MRNLLKPAEGGCFNPGGISPRARACDKRRCLMRAGLFRAFSMSSESSPGVNVLRGMLFRPDGCLHPDGDGEPVMADGLESGEDCSCGGPVRLSGGLPNACCVVPFASLAVPCAESTQWVPSCDAKSGWPISSSGTSLVPANAAISKSVKLECCANRSDKSGCSARMSEMLVCCANRSEFCAMKSAKDGSLSCFAIKAFAMIPSRATPRAAATRFAISNAAAATASTPPWPMMAASPLL
mmetsp:Transcript_12337/g.33771  ORF Transcript_12337/g.33771 Transcript_12337/m.33771 type:complete len:239 (+) Transcript_12337:2259-2975(+)